ncbi:plastocyanin/azurin family copper-binding protein [Pyruvatibacter sp.]|uniref:cupredoxin domain-containing protein n=1 Tax=Pyruvatibacter sp. TaxID=1981328 RepID=UPI003263CD3E
MSINFRFHKLPSLVAALAIIAAGSAQAAGSGDHHHGAGHGNEATPVGPMSFGNPGKAADADRVVEIVMGDNYFEPETLSFTAGETIHFKVVNSGTLVHEFNLGTPSYHEAHQGEMMMMQQHGVLMGDHINHEMMNMPMGDDGHVMRHDHPNSVLLEPGKSGDIVWTFTSGGDIEFACNVPGHYAAGMVGTVDVE